MWVFGVYERLELGDPVQSLVFRAQGCGLLMLNVPEDTTDVIYAEDEEVGACEKYSEAQKVLL